MINRKCLPLCLVLLGLTACSNPFKKEKIPLEGERETILLHDNALKPTSAAEQHQVILPTAKVNTNWDQIGGCASHCTPPVATANNPQVVWEASIGSSAGSSRRFLSPPIVHDGRLYVLNADQLVQAIDSKTGESLWQQPIRPAEISSDVLGGGLAYGQDKIYVASAYAEVLALDANNGEIKWRTSLNSPARSAPTVQNGRVFITTINNELEAFDSETGKSIWSHVGFMETAGLLGGASPAVANDVVVTPYSSGEVFALRADNGHPLWSESLASFKRIDSVSSIPHIRASPVIDQNVVFLVSHSGRMAALNLRSGERVWEREIGSIEPPAVAGDFLFLVTTDCELVCLTKREGHIKWVTPLPRFENETESKGKIVWHGPLLVNNELVLTGINQEMIVVNAQDGKEIRRQHFSDRLSVPAIAANETIFILTDGGNIVALR